MKWWCRPATVTGFFLKFLLRMHPGPAGHGRRVMDDMGEAESRTWLGGVVAPADGRCGAGMA